MIWQQDANCVGLDAETFFPKPGANATTAKAICARCPVIAECLAFAMPQPSLLGIWGGTSEQERRSLREGRFRQGTRPISHGTSGGHRTHLRRGETPCAECLEASRVARVESKARRAAA